MEGDLVSAVITTHNRKELLVKAIQSVLNQTYNKIEIIVVDDASDDGTEEYIKENFGNKVNYNYIEKKESKGGNYARNLGIKLAKGKYVAFLDDDDEWMPTKIEKQVNIIKNNDKIKVVACKRIFQYDFKKEVIQKEKSMLSGDLSKKIFTCMPYTTSSLLVEKNKLYDVGLFDVNLMAWQEYDIMIRLCQVTEIGVVNEPLLLYRVRTNDKARITNNLDKWQKSVDIIEKKYKEILDSLPNDIYKKHMALIASDGARRAGRINNRKLQKKYLKQNYENEKNIKNLIKYIFNISRIRG